MVILTSYSGPPQRFNNFFIDNGLAKIATYLNVVGISAGIYDLNSAEIWGDFNTESYRKDIEKIISSNPKELLKNYKHIYSSYEADYQLYVEKRLFDVVEKHRPDVLGIKLWFGVGAVFWNRVIPKLKRKYPEMYIVIGGPSVDTIGERLFDFYPNVDCLVSGAGEQILEAISKSLRNGAKLPSSNQIFYNKNNSFDKQPLRTKNIDFQTDYYSFSLNDKMLLPKIFVVENGFGCKSRCSFCAHPTLVNEYSQVNVDDFLNYIDGVSKKTESNYFRLSASNTPIGYLKRINEANTRFKYSSFLSLKSIENHDLSWITNKNIKSLFIGIEFLDQNILKNSLNKNYDVSRAKLNINHLIKKEIYITGSLIYPVPLMSNDSTGIGFKNLVELKSNYFSVTVNFPSLRPNTEWWIDNEKFKIIFDSTNYIENILFNTSPNDVDFSFDHNSVKTLKEMNVEYKKDILKAGINMNLTDEETLAALSINENPNVFIRNMQADLKFFKNYQVIEKIKKINSSIMREYNENKVSK